MAVAARIGHESAHGAHEGAPANRLFCGSIPIVSSSNDKVIVIDKHQDQQQQRDVARPQERWPSCYTLEGGHPFIVVLLESEASQEFCVPQ
mmetsp:Transcript_172/g.310  ORF Transcript_172/g.310 Transcript_172/m.310 type:complete len:91 (+) Transcript_172:60-332(+)